MRAELLRRLHVNLVQALARLRRTPSDSAVHAVRVAARRLRSLLRAARDDLHPTLYAGLQFDLRNLGRTLSSLRETSVRRRLLRSLQQSLDSSVVVVHGEALGSLHAMNAQTEQSLRMRVRQILPSAAWEERVQRIEDAISGTALLGVVAGPVQHALPEALNLSVERVVKRLKERKSSPGALHRIRLAVKKARYLAEMSVEVTDSGEQMPDVSILDVLKKLQKALGELNDLFQLRDWLADASIDAGLKRELAREIERRIDARVAKFQTLRKSAHEALVRRMQTG